ncbi:hypothetical protein [Streptomyces sp. NPDC050856]|uniref:hypothetical protein n=1 Tax=Streptomyces sp. NPDC050856 TaxID=3154939 RepID=UPI0033F18448
MTDRKQTLRLEVTHNLYVVTDTDAEEPDDMAPDSNGLVWVNADANQANVMTGTAWGPIDTTVDMRTSAPDNVDEESWDEIVEVSLHFTGDGPLLGSLITGDLEVLPLPRAVGEKRWRFRFHARGRDAASAAGDHPTQPDGAPLEQHLIQVWPAPYAPETRYKVTDTTGARSRADR